MSTEPKEKRKRAPRRNWQHEVERLTMYLTAAVRILESNASDEDLEQAGRLKAYKDCLNYLEGK